jgi:hypothetical protein
LRHPFELIFPSVVSQRNITENEKCGEIRDRSERSERKSLFCYSNNKAQSFSGVRKKWDGGSVIMENCVIFLTLLLLSICDSLHSFLTQPLIDGKEHYFQLPEPEFCPSIPNSPSPPQQNYVLAFK